MAARRLLVWLLRVTGATMMWALVFVFCPFGWMQGIHGRLGMGELGYTPLLSYLIRTLSALYATFGALCLFISFDVDRYRHLILFLAWLGILSGIGVTALDALLRFPLFWSATEGPFTIALSLTLIALVARMPAEAAGA